MVRRQATDAGYGFEMLREVTDKEWEGWNIPRGAVLNVRKHVKAWVAEKAAITLADALRASIDVEQRLRRLEESGSASNSTESVEDEFNAEDDVDEVADDD